MRVAFTFLDSALQTQFQTVDFQKRDYASMHYQYLIRLSSYFVFNFVWYKNEPFL